MSEIALNEQFVIDDYCFQMVIHIWNFKLDFCQLRTARFNKNTLSIHICISKMQAFLAANVCISLFGNYCPFFGLKKPSYTFLWPSEKPDSPDLHSQAPLLPF